MTTEENTALWDRVQATDPKHVKPITGKQYKGSSPDPYYVIRRLTEEFGPCGVGWGPKVLSERIERLSDTDSLHIAHVQLWYIDDQGKRGEIEQMGQTKCTYMTSSDKFYMDEDAPKKSVTDALTKCASYLGFCGDIFIGLWDDSKYQIEVHRMFAEPAALPKWAEKHEQAILACATSTLARGAWTTAKADCEKRKDEATALTLKAILTAHLATLKRHPSTEGSEA